MSPAAHDIPTDHVDVAIVGGGPAGLTAATALRRAGAGSVVIIEREHETGGIPRHARHQGFGIRDLHRIMSGPDYAARLTDRHATPALSYVPPPRRPGGPPTAPWRPPARPEDAGCAPAPSSLPPAAASARAPRASWPAAAPRAS